jgi:hypothetical protein
MEPEKDYRAPMPGVLSHGMDRRPFRAEYDRGTHSAGIRCAQKQHGATLPKHWIENAEGMTRFSNYQVGGELIQMAIDFPRLIFEILCGLDESR